MDTVTLSNGLKALFGTSQSTATNIPTCAADGTPAGNISVANLASVLGAEAVPQKIEIVDNLTDMNNLTTTNEYYRFVWVYSDTTIANLPSDIPSTIRFFVKVFQASNNYITQEIMSPINNCVYQRFKYNANWSSWVRNDNYGTSSLSELAASLGGHYQYPLSAPDDDDIYALPKKTACYAMSGYKGSIFQSGSFGVITVHAASVSYATMEIMCTIDGVDFRRYIRQSWNSNGWGAWKQVTLT